MEFYEVINTRRSIRQFEDREISREVLERILDAGLKAPSSNHQRRWELLTLTDKAMIMELAKFIRPYPCRIQEPKTPQQEMFKIAYPRQRSMIEESACVILPYYKQKYPLSEDKNGYGLMDYGATWALIENMLLAATAEMTDHHPETPVITMSMGALGAVSRLCGEAFGSAMTFANPGTASAPGQVGLDVVNAVLDSLRLS